MIEIRDLKAGPPEEYRPKKNAVLSTRNLPQKKTAEETWDWLIRKGMIDSNHLEARIYTSVEGAWRGEPCYIVGSGPPLRDVVDLMGWEWLRGRQTIGINHTIEEWDGFEWFFFLDKRFLDKTTYDLKKFRGTIFAQATTGLKMGGNVVVYHCSRNVGTKMSDGLYDGNLSGLAALNLALIAGADPIYLLGYGMGQGASAESYHYRKDYTGETKNQVRFQKFKNVLSKFSAYRSYADRIVHVTTGRDIPWFKKMSPQSFASKLRVAPVKEGPVVAHFSFSADPSVHAEITRHVLKEGRGRHFLVDVHKKEISPADAYVMEHFLSTDVASRSLPANVKAKTIDVVHTAGCNPTPGFARVVAITEAWQKLLADRGIKSVLIRGGIDLKPYGVASYEAKTFGRMTRWGPKKIHPEWNRIAAEILEEIPDSRCLFFVDKVKDGGRPLLQHHRMIYSQECKIDMDKAPYLQRLSVYVHANGGWKETMSHACVEAIACGLPVVYLTEGTGVLEEVVGPGGIRCSTMAQVKAAVKRLLLDPAACAEIGRRAKAQAQLWNKDRMVREFDALVKEVVG